jgi:GNAT superfamily N-acetyltransferase
MQITAVTEEHLDLFCVCLEDWSDEPKEAGDRRRVWYETMKQRGLGAKLALDDDGRVGGMIQYAPIEQSIVAGRDLYFIYCIWVHGYKKGRGNFQKRGMGTALLEAAEQDAKESGAKGMAAWGLALPFWMKASWFRKHGYQKADRDGMALLVWKPFTENATPPKWLKQGPPPESVPGKVTVTAFTHGWCMGQNLILERARRASAEFGDRVEFREFDTLGNPMDLLACSQTDAVFVDGKQIRQGPPPSYDKIRKTIAGRVKRLRE